ncbi:MAG: hypothetical protein QM820_52805 [Minicystis sp.]
MGWRGFVRSVAAAQRQNEREARRRQRELLQYQRELARMEERQRAAYEVEVNENQIEVVKSFHKDVSNFYDWQAILAAPPPQPPAFYRAHEQTALAQLHSYKPDFTDKLFGKDQENRQKLELAVEQARQQDAWAHQQAMGQYQLLYERWQWYQRLGRGILTGDIEAYRAALTYLSPFAELSDFGSSVEVKIDRPHRIELGLKLHGDSIIPSEEKRLLGNGRLSSKPMPTSRFNELYQDHVCSAALRVAGETFAVLPVTMALVHADAQMLDSATGRRGFVTILSVVVMRETFESLNLDAIDCSDSMRNFSHRMDFKKARGFAPVERLGLDDLRSS